MTTICSIWKPIVCMACPAGQPEMAMRRGQFQEWLSGIDRLSAAKRGDAEAAVDESRRVDCIRGFRALAGHTAAVCCRIAATE